jgi:hypothetical protein
MPSDNRLELVVEVDATKANASIKSVNTGLSSIEATARRSQRRLSGIDGMTVVGSPRGRLHAGSEQEEKEAGRLPNGWAAALRVNPCRSRSHEPRATQLPPSRPGLHCD